MQVCRGELRRGSDTGWNVTSLLLAPRRPVTVLPPSKFPEQEPRTLAYFARTGKVESYELLIGPPVPLPTHAGERVPIHP